MSIEQTWQTESTNLDATLGLAEQIGARLKGGETIVLVGDLGAGKTAFTKGLVRGIGSSDTVKSPSFTLSNQYQAGALTIHHFDFYRLNEPGIMRDELAEVIADQKAVVILEWADIIKDVLPADHLTIQIRATGENSRQFVFNCTDKLNYLTPINT